MSIRVRFVFWSPEIIEIPLEARTCDLYKLPEPNSHYWHGDAGYLVERIENADSEVLVHLLRDVDWEKRVLAGLPDDYRVVGGRQSTDGSWHFAIYDPHGRLVVSPADRGFELESALRRTVTAAFPKGAVRGLDDFSA